MLASWSYSLAAEFPIVSPPALDLVHAGGCFNSDISPYWMLQPSPAHTPFWFLQDECYGLAQPRLSPDPHHTHANGCCKSCGLAGEFPVSPTSPFSTCPLLAVNLTYACRCHYSAWYGIPQAFACQGCCSLTQFHLPHQLMQVLESSAVQPGSAHYPPPQLSTSIVP